MPVKYTYLLVDFFCIIFPFLFSFHSRLQFHKHWRSFLIPCIGTAIFFLVWDAIFTHIGVWSFNPEYVIGIYFAGMPVEEMLFFICIPYACVFSYHCFDVLFNFSSLQKPIRFFYAILSVTLLITAFFHLSQLYTSVTFILTAILLIYLVAINAKFIATFFFCFLFILIPFILSNGVLTGSFFGRTVVLYNDAHNLGIRILTIPFEDTFYGMLLLLMNVWGYERFRKPLN
ncbi:MAG: lycopene cyclase domain-containing protein [Chitinophagaceae bacterium]|jgi:lycopene cyclase domain-containing protein